VLQLAAEADLDSLSGTVDLTETWVSLGDPTPTPECPRSLEVASVSMSGSAMREGRGLDDTARHGSLGPEGVKARARVHIMGLSGTCPPCPILHCIRMITSKAGCFGATSTLLLGENAVWHSRGLKWLHAFQEASWQLELLNNLKC